MASKAGETKETEQKAQTAQGDATAATEGVETEQKAQTAQGDATAATEGVETHNVPTGQYEPATDAQREAYFKGEHDSSLKYRFIQQGGETALVVAKKG